MITIRTDPTNRGGYVLETETVVARPLEEVFAFFADAMNLERITPPWLQFQVVTPGPFDMHAGTLIDYRLKIHHVPVRWRTEIAAWEPPYRFVDTQLRGPYRHWRHEHQFEAVEGGTLCRDVVRYGVPGGALIHRLLVRRDVQQIFTYRERALHEQLAPQQALQSA
ncbi:SRPBCC family protein [Aeoliella sp. ICT_H6.2]|uniref:SRPBCC family protein n=1 Tax=Aeoliella straminimaris TaxID=2954799 RepID=A0A9X2FAI5_9BACT|nr:SRPBCC family protein [Aeoliella straminimaris]MCO6044964.1 SRPBCC family protein [Aeoliella straminimaris]